MFPAPETQALAVLNRYEHGQPCGEAHRRQPQQRQQLVEDPPKDNAAPADNVQKIISPRIIFWTKR